LRNPLAELPSDKGILENMEELKQISAEASAAIEAANDLKILEQLRVDYLGKKRRAHGCA